MKRKKVMTLLLSTALTFGMALPGVAYGMDADRYSDVSTEDSFFGYVEDVTDYGIMDALEGQDDVFGVAEKITRGDMVVDLYKMMMEPTVNGSLRFEDALDTDYEEAVVWADSVGLFEGLKDDFFVDDEFAADTEVTREQAAVILYNMATKVLKLEIDSEDPDKEIKDADGNVLKSLENLDEYEDGKDVTAEYLDAVRFAVGYGLLNPATTDTEDERYDEQIAGKLHMADTIEKVDLAEAISELLGMLPEDSEVETAKTAYEAEQKAESSDDGYVASNSGSGSFSSSEKTESSSKPAHEHNWVIQEWGEEGHYEQQVVKEAWVEKIQHPEEGHFESVLVSPEISHEEEVVLTPEMGHREEIKHPEEGHFETVIVEPEQGHYERVLVSPEEGHWEVVVDEPEEGHFEKKEVSPEKGHWENVEITPEEGHFEYQVVGYEPIYEEHDAATCNQCGEDFWCAEESQEDFETALSLHEASHGDIITYTFHRVNHKVGEKPITEQVWVVDKEATYDDRWVVDEPAVYEQVWVVDKPAVTHNEYVVDKEAVYEDKWVVDVPAVTTEEYVVDKEAWTEAVWVVDQEQVSDFITVVDQEAVYEDQYVVDKAAWVEEVEHPAEYQDIWVVDKTAGYNWVCTGCGATREEGGLG